MRTTAAACMCFLLAWSGAARAEQSELRIAYQYGLLFMPLIVMDQQKIVQKHARDAGIADLTVTYLQTTGGGDMNSMLLSGNIDIASGGIPPFLTIWSRTKGGAQVKGVSAICSMPINLNTRDPNLHSIKDLKPNNKIAMPAAKISIQAIMLEMAAARAFGDDHYDKLDALGVTLAHPLAMASMLSNRGEVDLHFASPPYNFEELQHPEIHSILNSYDILGNATFEVLWATTKFVDGNPKLYHVFIDSFREAIDLINKHPDQAAKSYLAASKDPLTPAQVVEILHDPQVEFTMTPRHIERYVDFLTKIGFLKTKPANMESLFFPEAAALMHASEK